MSKFNVDNLTTGVTNVDEGTDLNKKLKICFDEAQFNLCKFCIYNEELHVFNEFLDMTNSKVLHTEWDEFNKLIFPLSNPFGNATIIKASVCYCLFYQMIVLQKL